jgi:predicted nuclease of predicted toxin-antitoxin system
MQFLVGQNVPLDVVEGLCGEARDVIWAQTADPGAGDETLLKTAQEEARILLTFDTDFGALAFDRGLPASSGIILFRLTPVSPAAVAGTVLKTIRSREDWRGHFSVMGDTQIRMRPLPE